MVTAVIAQPAEPMDSGEVPRFELAQAPSCCPMTGMLGTLSAEAPTWLPKAAATTMAPASAAARGLKDGLGNLTNRNLVWTTGQNAPILRGVFGANKRRR